MVADQGVGRAVGTGSRRPIGPEELEAVDGADPGDVLVVDNGERTDEACVRDLVALGAGGAGLSGVVVWGLHGDTTELRTHTPGRESRHACLTCLTRQPSSDQLIRRSTADNPPAESATGVA